MFHYGLYVQIVALFLSVFFSIFKCCRVSLGKPLIRKPYSCSLIDVQMAKSFVESGQKIRQFLL